MFNFHFKNKKKYADIAPDEIFLDSTNLMHFDRDQFEGRIEKPISRRTIFIAGGFFLIVTLIFFVRVGYLQLSGGEVYRSISENNSLHHSLIFSERGVITDRNGTLLAWNEIDPTQTEYALRKYKNEPGFFNLLGFIRYPKKDKSGFYYNTEYTGADGIEKYFNATLAGDNGLKINETDVLGKAISESVVHPPKNGDKLALSIDATLQESLYTAIKKTAIDSGFKGGAGVIMDIHTGEVLAMVSYPEYDSNIMTESQDTATINGYLKDTNNPFLDRITSGLYAPGSILKPIFAFGALAEGIISPDKQIESTGELKLPNPYKPGEFSVFKDWRVNGWTDMRKAIAVSSDVYFYEIGGGFQDQKGLGIQNIEKYVRMFGFGDTIADSFFSGKKGVIPNEAWKAATFNGDAWRVGDTYNTTIGQYGFQVTPIQAVRATAALANGGTLLKPTIVLGDASGIKEADHVPVTDPSYYRVIREGMRQTVTEGTAQQLQVPYVTMACKTGTAQVGARNEYINSWNVGFFPYENPKYAYALLLERGPSTTTVGAAPTMRYFLDLVMQKTLKYFAAE